MSKHHSYYDVLNVERDAPLAVVRASYRRLMQLGNHPDRGGDSATAALINKAYAVLRNPEQRDEYDLWLDAQADADPVARTVRVRDRECVFCATPHEQGRPIDVDSGCDVCRSPLSSPENLHIDADGQRGMARIEKQLNVRFFTHWRQTNAFVGRTEDVSLIGMRMVANQPLQAGQLIKVVCGVFDAVGVIAHCGTRRKGLRLEHVAGVSFVTLRLVKTRGGLVSRHA